MNPAELATRSLSPDDLSKSMWFIGPDLDMISDSNDKYELLQPEGDKEIRQSVNICKTVVVNKGINTNRFTKFSSWKSLVRAIMLIRAFIRKSHSQSLEREMSKVDLFTDCEKLILRRVQEEEYGNEIKCLKNNQSLRRDSTLLPLSPTLDEDGLLRVGGRLNRAQLPINEKNPVIVPRKHHIAILLIRHFHEQSQHQGRHITEGAIRAAGYWIIGGKRLISSILHNCVICKKLRGKAENPKMSDLPIDRLTPSPPFTFVGVDTFGPWPVVTRRTRGVVANSKRWAIMFSCLVSRGIHIEIIEELSSSSFINALRRFIALRGPVIEFRSDRGTNFVGATGEMNINVMNIEDKSVNQFLINNKTTWKFNAPHASHMSGSWERMIGTTRKILDAMLLKESRLTHEILCTVMSEVCAIVNARPIVAVSTDPDAPSVLSPSTLITQKLNNDTQFYDNIDVRDMYKSQWKYVQLLADSFWKQWKMQFLQNLQSRPKWCEEINNIQKRDIVLLKDKELTRNQWSVGIIDETFPSEDGRIRKVSVRITKNGNQCTYTRPTCELVYLLSP